MSDIAIKNWIFKTFILKRNRGLHWLIIQPINIVHATSLHLTYPLHSRWRLMPCCTASICFCLFVYSICPCPAIYLFRQLILIRRNDRPWKNVWRASICTNSRTIIDPWGITLSFIQIYIVFWSNSTAEVGVKHQSISNNSWLVTMFVFNPIMLPNTKRMSV